ncbi:MAG: hypothetical protein EB830_00400 [Nitrosopumilus sp. H13]|nr:MAG: hypothetical protein EB830_00400 [Nitrosopumilus sp. H13]
MIQESKRPKPIGGQKKGSKPAARAGFSKADEKFLLGSQRQLIRVFRQVAMGRTARVLDDAFEDFDLPRIAKRRRQSSSPSGVVLASDTAVIKHSELDRYEAVLAVAKKRSQALRDLDALMKRCNERIRRILKRSGIIYRGMAIAELEIIAKHGGIFGFHPRIMYAAKNNFVSFSIDPSASMPYATGKRTRGLLVDVDVSGIKKSKYMAVPYEARNGIKVTDRGMRVYDPYEMFGGGQSGMALREFEVHLQVGSRPIIRTVTVIGGRSAYFRRRLTKAVACLERAQKQRITIKYLHDQS